MDRLQIVEDNEVTLNVPPEVADARRTRHEGRASNDTSSGADEVAELDDKERLKQLEKKFDILVQEAFSREEEEERTARNFEKCIEAFKVATEFAKQGDEERGAKGLLVGPFWPLRLTSPIQKLERGMQSTQTF